MADNIQGIVINEILSNPAGFDTDNDGNAPEKHDEFFELFNTSNNAVDISGWRISSSSETETYEYFFPGAVDNGTTVIPAGQKLTVVSNYTGEVPEGYLNVNAGENSTGDAGRISDSSGLFTLAGSGQAIGAEYGRVTTLTTLVGYDNFGSSPIPAGESFNRIPDGSDTFGEGAPTPECFLTGTRVLTESGYKTVEELQIGDKVETAEGELVDVKWIGYQTIDPNAIAIPLRGNPVLVKAGALGNSLPTQDLYISPDHSLFVDGLLINAGALVNGTSIIQTEPTETFVYHSVELEQHALLTVEGTFAESYMPHHEDRANYDNGAEYEELYPHGSNLMLWPMDYPRISSKRAVPSFVVQKLANIAQQLKGEALISA